MSCSGHILLVVNFSHVSFSPEPQGHFQDRSTRIKCSDHNFDDLYQNTEHGLLSYDEVIVQLSSTIVDF